VSVSAPCSLSLALPPGFHVLAAHDSAVVDPLELDDDRVGGAWLNDVRASTSAAGALLCALHTESWQGEIAQASLVVTARPFADDPALLLAAMRLHALQSTSTSGQVCLLQLPLGPAVGTVDVVVVGDDRSRTGLVEVQVIAASSSTVVQLTLGTPTLPLLAAYAAMTADIAAQLSLGLEEDA